MISPSTGALITNGAIPSSIQNGLTDFLVISDTLSARVVWLEQGTLKSITLTPELQEKSLYIKSTSFKAIQNVGLMDKGYFVALRGDGTSRVMKISNDGKNIKGIAEFADSVSIQFVMLYGTRLSVAHRWIHRQIPTLIQSLYIPVVWIKTESLISHVFTGLTNIW